LSSRYRHFSERPINPLSIPAKLDKTEVSRQIFFDRVNKTIPICQPNEQSSYQQLELMAASLNFGSIRERPV
jgi:hypothetical protein